MPTKILAYILENFVRFTVVIHTDKLCNSDCQCSNVTYDKHSSELLTISFSLQNSLNM